MVVNKDFRIETQKKQKNIFWNWVYFCSQHCVFKVPLFREQKKLFPSSFILFKEKKKSKNVLRVFNLVFSVFSNVIFPPTHLQLRVSPLAQDQGQLYLHQHISYFHHFHIF